MISQLHPRPCFPISSRSDMRRIPKGVSYFRITRPLRFQISRSTGFLGATRRRIRLSLPSPLSTTPYVAMGLRVNRQRFRITANLSGLTWEDTTAYVGKDLHLTQLNFSSDANDLYVYRWGSTSYQLRCLVNASTFSATT